MKMKIVPTTKTLTIKSMAYHDFCVSGKSFVNLSSGLNINHFVVFFVSFVSNEIQISVNQLSSFVVDELNKCTAAKPFEIFD